MAARDIIQAAGGSAATSAAVYVEDVFSTYVYAGTGSNQTLTTGIDLSTNGGMIWSKRRSAIENNFIQDTVRGLTARLVSNATTAQTSSGSWPMSSVSTTGMTVSGTSYAVAGETYASWVFRKQPKFFDIVTYTGNDAAERTIPHNLGCVPGMIIIKAFSGSSAGTASAFWNVYHKSLSTGSYLYLQTTAAVGSDISRFRARPTSTEFFIGSDSSINNQSNTYVAYLFADSNSGGFGPAGTDSVVACGSWNAGASGADFNVSLGWEPQYILIKRTDDLSNWFVFDTMRGLCNVSANTGLGTKANPLYPNLSNAEATGTQYVGVSANGFNAAFGGGGTFIYLAIRRGPMKTPTDATKVFAPVTRTGTGSATSVTSLGFSPDLLIGRLRTLNGDNTWVVDKLRGRANYLSTSATGAENFAGSGASTSTQDITSLDQSGYSYGSANNNTNLNASGYTEIDWVFKRAPGFMDCVCYTGTGSATTVAHNLGVAPELMIVKRRDGIYGWITYSAALGNTKHLSLQGDAAPITGTMWNNTSPTNSVFSIGTSISVSSGTYVAYLFATCPGVSKVGSYTGTGAAQNINCGFTAGARFVLIKRTDSTGAWYTYDSARGINASGSNDPYLLLNSAAAEVTTTDYLGTYSSGFALTSSAPADLNASGGTYIFLAIA